MDFGEPQATVDASLLVDLLRRSDLIFIKKLSRNDRDWSRLPNKHQAGPYIPVEQRDAGFFPPLMAKTRTDGAEEIRETFFVTWWPQFGEERKTRLVNYRSKGEETHLTGVPKVAFRHLAPSSYLVIGQVADEPYICLTIDSASADALDLVDALSLPVDFEAVIRSPASERGRMQDELLSFADQAVLAWRDGQIAEFAARHAAMPDTSTLAKMAREKFLTDQGFASLDPFAISRPGDAIREISREIELEIFREYQVKAIAIALVRLVAGDDPKPASVINLVRALIEHAREIDALMLSASQQRRSRAGYSFEHHIEALLLGGRVPHEKQVVIEAKKRPDFILPSLQHLRRPQPAGADGLILSAKTTLRERWKQVQREMGESDLYLATVDESLSSNAIEDMGAMGITLVVPESMLDKDSIAAKTTEYRGHANVLSFRRFFDEVLRSGRLQAWGLSTH